MIASTENGLTIFITTRGRMDINKQSTYKSLSKKWRKSVRFVVRPEEASFFKSNYPKKRVVVLPESVEGLSDTRQWLLENSNVPYVCYMDDDLKFYYREDGKLYKAKAKHVDEMMWLLCQWLMLGIALVGVSTSYGNNWCEGEYQENTKVMSCYAFNVDKFRENNIRFDRVPLMQDYDMTLQVLEAGFKNRVACNYCHSEIGGSNAPGGCSIYRTPELIRETAFKLAMLHPECVKVVAKTSKTAWKGMEKKDGVNGTVRTDVNIQWNKAYKPRYRDNKTGIYQQIG